MPRPLAEPAARARSQALRSCRKGRDRLEAAYLRLQTLYEIGKLLTRFGGVDATVPAILGMVHEALGLRSAIFILDMDGSRRAIVWHAPGAMPNELQSAKSHARTFYRYLAGVANIPELEQGGDPIVAAASAPRVAAGRVLPMLLPFAVERRPIFGALQLEGARAFDEADLVFVNAIVNQLAIALDRHLTLERKQAAAERSMDEARARQADAEAGQARAERAEARAGEGRLAAERQASAVESGRATIERERSVARALGERYEAMVDNLDHAFVWEADAETFRMTYVSARAETVLGFSRQRLLKDGDFWLTRVHPQDREPLAQAFRRALSEKADQRCDHRCVAADGSVLWLHTGVHGVRGTTTRLQGVSIDVTPTKHAEEKLREQLDFARAVAHSIGEGVLAIDLQGRLTLCNAAAAQMLGCTESEALGQPVTEMLHVFGEGGLPLAPEESPFAVALRDGEPWSRDDCSFAGRSGERFAVSFTAGPLRRGGHVTGAVLAFKDTTERARAQLALREAVEHAERAIHDREDLLALVSHDLRNPLSIILMTAASIARTLDTADRTRAIEQLGSIKRSAERMNRLVKDLLDTASLDAGRLSLDRSACALGPLVDDALGSMRPLAAPKAIHLEQDIPPGVPLVWADADRLDQVLSNLLGNAIKFTPPNGVISVRVRPQRELVLVEVSDTGPGIPEAELPYIFDRYWQARRTAKLGSGLGLSIVKGIVTAHGGRVWAQSQVGVGSTFSFTLPAA